MADPASSNEQTTDVVIPAVPAPAPAPESSPSDVVLKVLGAIGTGIGILGFVTLFGGALIWVRAERAELPATEAVSVVPHNVLVTTGATFLVPAALIAAGVVACVFLLHQVLVCLGIRGFKLGQKRRTAKAQRQRSAKTGRTAVTEQQNWKLAEAALRRRQTELDAAHKRQADAAEIARLQRAVSEKQIEAERLLEISERSVSAAATAKASADNLTEEAEEKLERGGLQWWVEMGVAGILLIIVVPMVNGSICHLPLDGWEFWLLVLAAIAGTTITLLVYRETEKFVWFGVVAFLAVGVYLAAATYFSTHRNPKLQPVAALRPGHDPVVGSYVAATSESLYVGTFREKETPPRLLVIPRAQVIEFVIGPPLETARAHRRAFTMAINECEKMVLAPAPEAPAPEETADKAGAEQAEAGTGAGIAAGKPTGKQPPKYKKACSGGQIKALNGKLNAANRTLKADQLDQPG